ncbi:phage terminase small subunit [Kitasatospora purpeofusca]|uniref:phage terminase small subunit n=1 Tax=Kitasatospora purpeofusca TaxID=67352 RepID=UPI0035DF678A
MTRGPRPKENAVRRNVHSHAQELTPDAQPGRELPRGLGITTSGAKRFWKTWATSPQSARWAETDWAELEITTRLVDALYQGDLRHAGEVRQRTAKWGATVEDRARLRMSIKDEHQDQAEDADQAPAETTTDLDEELFRLLNS